MEVPTNEERAQRGWGIIQAYREQHEPEGDEDNYATAQDAIADILHFAESDGLIPENVLRAAVMHWMEESPSALSETADAILGAGLLN